MTKFRHLISALLSPLQKFQLFALRNSERRLQRYLLTALAGISAIIVIAAITISVLPERFTSRWTLIIPGSGADANLVLQGIGQASSNSASPYTSISRSPRVNYRELVMSDTVLSLAAEKAEMTTAELGRPSVKLIAQSSMMNFTISAESATLAIRKAEAINLALRETLDRLRQDELALRETGMQSAIAVYASRLQVVRDELLAHQEATQLVSANQVDGLVASVASIRQELVGLRSEIDDKTNYLAKLAGSLNLSESLVAAAVVLHADETTRQLTQRYVAARDTLESKRGIFGPNHPRMIAAAATRNTTKADFKARAFELLGRRDIDIDRLVLLDVEDSTGALFRELVSLSASIEGARAREQSLAAQLQTLQEELQTKLVAVAQLSDLERDHKIAEAVFSSALARIDTGKSDLFVSYPLVQTIVAPTLPAAADRKSRMFVAIGALAASLCFLTGLLLLWYRA